MTGGVVVGLGCRPGVAESDVRSAVRALLDRLEGAEIRCYATIDTRIGEPGLRAVAGEALLGFPAEVLAAVPVPNPSGRVAKAVGSPSVAEAAALRGAAFLSPPSALVELVVPKLVAGSVTAAAARIRNR